MNGHQFLLDYNSAIRSRDTAVAQVAENSEELGWMPRAFAAVPSVLADLPAEFPAEAIRIAITLRIGEPHTPNVWGAFTNSLIKKKFIEETGHWIAMLGSKSHGRRTPMYRVANRGGL